MANELMKREDFYRRRDQRTVSYVDASLTQHKVTIEVGQHASRSAPGQQATLALANQAARVHQNIRFVAANPGTSLLSSSPFGGKTLGDALTAMCKSIDPYGEFDVIPASDVTSYSFVEDASVGIGQSLNGHHDWHIGADRAIARLDKAPLPIDTSAPATHRGAALASCLGAAALFRMCFNLPVVPRQLSAWNLREDNEAAPGPAALPPVDVGRVLLIGAGAVGGALAFWLHSMGVRGQWTVIDADRLTLHNMNRHLLSSTVDAGWSNGTLGKGAYKSAVVSRHLPGSSEVAWYHESELSSEPHDVILCLANEHDVRTQVAQRNAPVMLHATTGVSWLSQLHRHVAGYDDCIRCRTRDVREAELDCSKAPVDNTAEDAGQDAALPFLSAASGLMLATALQRLQAETLLEDPRNDWRWDFASTHRMSTGAKRTCRQECTTLQPPAIRTEINKNLRWAHLDADASN